MKPKNNLVYIMHMIESINYINEFIKDVDYKKFCMDELINSAVIRKIEILGEAASNLEKEFQIKYSYVPWQLIKDMRNVLIHEYMGVDFPTVWNTIQIEIPKLNEWLHDIQEKERIKTK